MAAPRPLEHDLTKEAEDLLARFSGEYVIKYSLNRFEARMLLLEAVSSRFGGFDYLEYQNELRLSFIYQDIISTDDSIKDILERHGFTNYKLFRRMFFEHFKATPTEVRKMHDAKKNS